MTSNRVDFIVPFQYLELLKTNLKTGKKINKSRAIAPVSTSSGQSGEIEYAIPTLYLEHEVAGASAKYDEIGLGHIFGAVTVATEPCVRLAPNPPREVRETIGPALTNSTSLPASWSIYEPMLLLPQTSFSTPEWKAALTSATKEERDALYVCIADAFSITHIAINAPIPLAVDGVEGSTHENILRAPLNLTPVYGDFGPLAAGSNALPTPKELASSLWVSAKQYGILQTWAPLHTMFSRGNIKEKARILDLQSVQTAVDEGRADGRGCSAVDLYAGIGYFVFSYAKAGVDKVYCWELNPWSVEGLRRGAEGNQWSVGVVKNNEVDSFEEDAGKRIVVFEANNETAAAVLNKAKHHIPPVRHVNCGLLPTSRGSWRTAVEIIDSEAGGWIHLHENFLAKDIEVKGKETLKEIQGILDENTHQSRRTAILEHIERVKTYAPGVWHCVLDIFVPPKNG